MCYAVENPNEDPKVIGQEEEVDDQAQDKQVKVDVDTRRRQMSVKQILSQAIVL